MLFKKFTTGVVEQTFNDAGECISQEFQADEGADVRYETEEGDGINVMDMPLAGREYHPFDMVQPQGCRKPEDTKNPFEIEANELVYGVFPAKGGERIPSVVKLMANKVWDDLELAKTQASRWRDVFSCAMEVRVLHVGVGAKVALAKEAV